MTNIVSIVDGDYTPGAESTLHAAADIINAAWTLGTENIEDFKTKVSSILSTWLASTATPTVSAGTVTTPAVTEPDVDIPSSLSVDDAISTFRTQWLEQATWLADKFGVFRNTYFPDETTHYTALSTWLANAMNNPTTGLPTAVANQLIEDDKSRILADAARASDAVIAQFAARRFPLPPGAAAAAVSDIQQKAQDEIAASGRKVVMASIEQMRFVIEKTINLRQMAMSSAIEYIKALAMTPDIASRVVNIGYDAQSKLISAASQFYNSRTAVAELQSKVGQFNVQTALEAAEKNQMAELTMIEDKLKALITEAQLLAQTATALFNNVHVGSSLGYSVSG